MSRNAPPLTTSTVVVVAPREGRVSRNSIMVSIVSASPLVAPREGRVSRNDLVHAAYVEGLGRAPRGACE